jgi:hypothetical protein
VHPPAAAVARTGVQPPTQRGRALGQNVQSLPVMRYRESRGYGSSRFSTRLRWARRWLLAALLLGEAQIELADP